MLNYYKIKSNLKIMTLIMNHILLLKLEKWVIIGCFLIKIIYIKVHVTIAKTNNNWEFFVHANSLHIALKVVKSKIKVATKIDALIKPNQMLKIKF